MMRKLSSIITEIKEFCKIILGKRWDNGLSSLQNILSIFNEFQEIIKYLSNWKAAGSGDIFNFLMKKFEAIHQPLYNVIKNINLETQSESNWFYKRITCLIPKKGLVFRPITCMSNFYKLTAKCVTEVMQTIVENRDLLADNQLGTLRMTQGASTLESSYQ